MEKKSFKRFIVLTVACLCLTGMGASTCNAQWWWTSSSSSSSSGGASNDMEKPVVTSFTLPASVTSRTIPITSFKVTDNVGVTGYLVNSYDASYNYEYMKADPGWTSRPPTSYRLPNNVPKGQVTLYAWARDAAGYISVTKSATTSGVPEVTAAPDLVVAKVINPAVTITTDKRTFTITDTVVNRGNITARASKMRYDLLILYINQWNQWLWMSQPLTGSRYVRPLRPGEISTGTVIVQVPSGTRLGNCTVRVWADDENVVDELDENNCKSSGTQITIQG